MIVNVLCHTPPEKFFKWADKHGLPYKDFKIVVGDEKEIKAKQVVFLEYNMFVRYARRVPSNATVYLFCPFHTIVQYAPHCNFLDVKLNGFECEPKKRIYVPKAIVEFQFERGATYPELLEDHVEKGSLLTHLMTYIYTLDSRTQQKPVMYIISCWMRGDEDWDGLVARLKKIDNPLKAKALETLKGILELGIAQRVRRSMQEVSDMDSVAAIAKSHAVEPYEVRYLLSKTQYTKKIIDDDIQVN